MRWTGEEMQRYKQCTEQSKLSDKSKREATTWAHLPWGK